MATLDLPDTMPAHGRDIFRGGSGKPLWKFNLVGLQQVDQTILVWHSKCFKLGTGQESIMLQFNRKSTMIPQK